MKRSNSVHGRQRPAMGALAVGALVTCAGLSSPGFAQSRPDGLRPLVPLDVVSARSANYRDDAPQIAAARAGVRRGAVAPQLQVAATLHAQGNADWAHPAGLERSQVDASSRLSVEFRIDASKREAVLQQLTALGFENRFPRGTRMLQGWLPAAAIEQAGGIDGVTHLSPARRAKQLAGSQMTDGFAAGRAQRWHDGGIDGTGITIAVIDGFDNNAGEVAALQGTGNWPAPANLTTVSMHAGAFGANNTSHGMSTMEIAYDIAPGATFIAYDTRLVTEWIAAIYDAVDTRGANVISVSLGAPLDGKGDGSALPDSVAEAAEYALANDVIIVNAAGNERLSHYGGLYDSDGVAFTNDWGDYDNSHRFNPGNTDARGEVKSCVALPQQPGLQNTLIPGCLCMPNGNPVTLQVYWNDWDNVDHDYDVHLYRLSGTELAPAWTWIEIGSGGNIQTGNPSTDVPWEFASFTAAGTAGTTSPGCPSNTRVYAYQISHYEGTPASPRNLQVFNQWYMDAPNQDFDRSLSFPADSPAVVTVAAVDAGTSLQEDYSSEGPILAPGGGIPTGSEALKPDVTSFANVDTATAGPNAFNGTSAATPHVAGMTALLWQRMGGPGVASAADVRAALLDIAGAGTNDLGVAGAETQHGQGRVRFQVEDELTFLQQPSDSTVDTPIAPAVEIAVLDDEGEPVLHGLVDDIALGFGTDPSGGTASLTHATEAVSLSQATYPTLSIDTAGTGYTLTASATTLNSETLTAAAASDAFDIALGNSAPTVATPIGDQSNAEGDIVGLDIAAGFDDADGDTLDYAVTGTLPPGLSLAGDSIVGTIDFTAADASPYAVTITADDGNGSSVDDSFSWTVTDVVRPNEIFMDGFETLD